MTLIEFLTDLKREFRGQRLTLVWDGLPSHRSGLMQAYLHAQRSWLTVERLPGYAPDLNPAELVWGNVKGRELANLCADNLAEVAQELRAGLRRVRRSPTLAFAFPASVGHAPSRSYCSPKSMAIALRPVIGASPRRCVTSVQTVPSR